jgi:hypothetical protein
MMNNWNINVHENVNPKTAEFLKWTCPCFNFETVHSKNKGFQCQNTKMKLTNQYRAWSYCTDGHAGTTLYWRQSVLLCPGPAK